VWEDECHCAAHSSSVKVENGEKVSANNTNMHTFATSVLTIISRKQRNIDREIKHSRVKEFNEINMRFGVLTAVKCGLNF
jgi:hypothetical protein